jgi:predicted Zn-ribbon and HTH transcriptional regulator
LTNKFKGVIFVFERNFMTEHTFASWTIELNTECPKCEHYFNLLDSPDFYEYSDIKLGESGKMIDATCPECGYEFKVESDY